MRADTAKMIWGSAMMLEMGVALGPRYSNAASRESILAATPSTGEAHEFKPKRKDKRSRKQRRKESKR